MSAPPIHNRKIVAGAPNLPPLSPSQAIAFADLQSSIGVASLLLLEGKAGFGTSLVISHLCAQQGCKRLSMRDVFALSVNSAHAALEAPLMSLLDEALNSFDIVVLEDLDAMSFLLDSGFGYVRADYWQMSFQAIIDRAHAEQKTLVLTANSFQHLFAEFDLIPRISQRSMKTIVLPFPRGEDYECHLVTALGGELADQINMRRLRDHAPKLNHHQLSSLAGFVRNSGRTDSAFITTTLDEYILASNAVLSEVEDLDFDDLKGFEDIVGELTTYVINPLKGDECFADLDLRPKRGVLLFGPPGTGKTSVGRALAHRMQGKFFLIDGTIHTDPSDHFYNHVRWIFEQAKRASPSIVFIDDADVIFQTDRGTGLTRYLLTMLDGLESETAGKVAVVLTAMNVSHIPPAVLRSGRVELWLETRPPVQRARQEMLQEYLSDAKELLTDGDIIEAASLCENFNAADMRRLAMDIKALFARDVLAERAPSAARTYYEAAIRDIRRSRDLLAQASSGNFAAAATPN